MRIRKHMAAIMAVVAKLDGVWYFVDVTSGGWVIDTGNNIGKYCVRIDDFSTYAVPGYDEWSPVFNRNIHNSTCNVGEGFHALPFWFMFGVQRAARPTMIDSTCVFFIPLVKGGCRSRQARQGDSRKWIPPFFAPTTSP